MIVEDGVVTKLAVEAGGQLEVSKAERHSRRALGRRGGAVGDRADQAFLGGGGHELCRTGD